MISDKKENGDEESCGAEKKPQLRTEVWGEMTGTEVCGEMTGTEAKATGDRTRAWEECFQHKQ